MAKNSMEQMLNGVRFFFNPNEENISFYNAITQNDIKTVKKIVYHNKTIVNDIYNIRNPLEYSLKLNHNEIAKFLIDIGADLNPKFPFIYDVFMYCIGSNNYEMFLYLEKYIKPIPFQKSHYTYLDHITEKTSLEIFKHILKFYKSPFDRMIQNKKNILEYSLFVGNHDISEYLINLNVFDLTDGSYLYYALKSEFHDISWILIRKGCNLFSPTEFYKTPLFAAARNAYYDICEYLLDHGAEITCSYSQFFNSILKSKKDVTKIIKLIISRLFNNNDEILFGMDGLISSACHDDQIENLKFAMHYQKDINSCIKFIPPAIFAASLSSSIEIVKLLVNNGADLTLTTDKNYMVLHFAATNSFEVFEFLYSKISSSSINTITTDGKTPLSIAVTYGKLDIVKFILSQKNVSIPNKLFINAIESNSIDMMNYIEEIGYYFPTEDNIPEYIRNAFRYCSFDKIIFLFQKTKHIISTFEEIYPVFVRLLSNPHENTVFMFFRKFVIPITQSTVNGESFLAALFEAKKIISCLCLLMSDWNPNHITESTQESPLMHAAVNFWTGAVELLIEKGANINARDIKGQTILHYAAMSKNENSLRYFSRFGLDINITDYKGRAPLHIATKINSVTNVQYLISINADVNSVTRKGRNALYYAIRNNNQYLVEYFIKHNININQMDNYGKTPLKYAMEIGNDIIFNLLKEHNAIYI